MPITVTGQEFKAFYDDPSVFPEGAYHDSVLIYVDGDLFMSDIDDPAPRWKDAEVKDIPDTSRVRVEAGVIILGENGAEKDFVGALRGWRKQLNSVQLIVSVPKDKLEQVKAAIKSAGGRLET